MRLRAILLSLVMALAQILPVSVAPALAQFGSGLSPPGNSPGFTEGMLPDPDASAGISKCTPAPGSVPPLPMTPLDRDVTAVITVTVAKDGSITTVGVGVGSGDDARDTALAAHVQKNWHLSVCGPGRFRFRVHFPRIACAPQPLLETQTAPEVDFQDRPRSVDLQVGVVPDGTVALVSVTRSSGDAALDAAAMTHVKQAWRWQPYTCQDAKGDVLRMVLGTATIQFPYAVPDPSP
jgi:TonB family protein